MAFFIKIFPEQTIDSLLAKANTLVFSILLNADLSPAIPTIEAIVISVLRLAKLASSSSPLKHFTLPFNSFLITYNNGYQKLSILRVKFFC